jgi:transposase
VTCCVERVAEGNDSQGDSLPGPGTWRPQQQANVAVLFQARQAQREDRFQQAILLRQHGLSLVQIAQRVGRSERTIRNWLRRDTAPTYKQTRKRRSTFDPYAAYVLERWQAGVQDGQQLYEELVARGYTGSVRTVQRFIHILRPGHPRLEDLAPPSPLDQFSAREVVWLFLRDPTELSSEEAERVALMRRASALANTAYRLVQAFVRMLRYRHGEQLAAWLDAVQTSQIAELQRFAGGILKDYDAVLAGLTWNYSNGPVEAQVHKLKLVKRAMFGRAKLPLLRQRLLQSV